MIFFRNLNLFLCVIYAGFVLAVDVNLDIKPTLKNQKIQKEIKIKNYYKDHRIFMTSVIGGLVTGGKWTIHDVNSYRSSFPSFMNILRKIGFNATYR